MESYPVVFNPGNFAKGLSKIATLDENVLRTLIFLFFILIRISKMFRFAVVKKM